jgi:hypothetical protein
MQFLFARFDLNSHRLRQDIQKLKQKSQGKTHGMPLSSADETR